MQGRICGIASLSGRRLTGTASGFPARDGRRGSAYGFRIISYTLEELDLLFASLKERYPDS